MAVTPASAAMARMVAPAKPWVPKARRADASTLSRVFSSARALAGRPRRRSVPAAGRAAGLSPAIATAYPAPRDTCTRVHIRARSHRPDRHQRGEGYVAATDQGGAMGDGFEHGQVDANGISIHTVAMGDGPLVIFCHGFPESWYSWRHQLPAVAAAGYRAVAIDMRGYGSTSQPADIGAYTVSHLVGDVVGTVAALGEPRAVVVGHDWGAPIAWFSALMRPDMFLAVAALSVPYLPPIGALPEGVTLNDVMRANASGRDYYRLYFQEPGVAEADLEADLERSVLGFLYTISGDIVADGVHTVGWDGHFPLGESVTDQLVVPDKLPAWLSAEDLAFYVGELRGSGLRGGLNYYRNINALPAILAPFVGATIEQPALYLGGELDLIAGNTPEALAALPAAVPGLRRLEIYPGAGHWLQQERPDEVNAALVEFLRGL